MHKTVVTCFGTEVLGVVVIFLSYFFYTYKSDELAVEAATERLPADKLNMFVKGVTDESRQSNKVISAKEASDIQVNIVYEG